MVKNLEELEIEIREIKERNKRVEAEKAWETSSLRILSITVITYLIVVFVLYFIGVNNYLLNALVPTVGFLISTQSLPFIKNFFIKKYLK